MSHMQRAAHISTPHWLLWYVWWWSWSWEWNVQSAGNVSNGRPNRKLGCVHNLSVVKFEGLANCRSFLCWQACRWVSSRSLFDSRWPAALLNVTDLFSTCFTCNCPKIKNRGGGVLALIRAAVCASDSSAPPTLFGGISSSSSSLFLKRLICSGRPAWRQQVDAISTASTAITQQMDCHIPQRRRGPRGRTVRPCVYCPFHFFFSSRFLHLSLDLLSSAAPWQHRRWMSTKKIQTAGKWRRRRRRGEPARKDKERFSEAFSNTVRGWW